MTIFVQNTCISNMYIYIHTGIFLCLSSVLTLFLQLISFDSHSLVVATNINYSFIALFVFLFRMCVAGMLMSLIFLFSFLQSFFFSFHAHFILFFLSKCINLKFHQVCFSCCFIWQKIEGEACVYDSILVAIINMWRMGAMSFSRFNVACHRNDLHRLIYWNQYIVCVLLKKRKKKS